MVRSFQAERIRSAQRSTGKKAQKEENHPGAMRCSEGLDCVLRKECQRIELGLV